MIKHVFHACNVSSQLLSSVKGTFKEQPNVRKVMQVSIVNPFWLNGMETQGFLSAKPLTPFWHITSNIISFSFLPDTS